MLREILSLGSAAILLTGGCRPLEKPTSPPNYNYPPTPIPHKIKISPIDERHLQLEVDPYLDDNLSLIEKKCGPGNRYSFQGPVVVIQTRRLNCIDFLLSQKD
jgi:hypothetical protein